jgi:PAS domain-containing protein
VRDFMSEIKENDLIKRSNPEEISYQRSLFENKDILKTILHNMTEIAIVVNKYRQIIFSNELLLNMLGVSFEDIDYGLRPGELINCVNSDETENGCGNSKGCNYCGILNTILKSQNSTKEIKNEISVMLREGEKEKTIELLLKAFTIRIEGEIYTLVFLSDISEKRKREVLEKIFYHDLINKAGGLAGLIEILYIKNKDKSKFEVTEETISLLKICANELVEEILSQRE